MYDDTIIAISTPPGYGGLGIIRLSGPKAIQIARKIFKPYNKKRGIPKKHPVLGNLYNFETKEFFDEAYLTYFPSPHTYTREDIIEISGHGSPVLLEEAVRLGIKAGARLANKGEFTLRAFLKGRIDILQAESIKNLISASSLTGAKISFNQMKGGLSRRIQSIRNQIVKILSRIEACLEFPDENLHINSKQIQRTLSRTIYEVNELIKTYPRGKALSEGIVLTILGRTNVGKSTLFNSLIKSERAIVTPYPGTTRDYLKENLRLGDTLFSLIDTAGLTVPANSVEKESMKKGRKQAKYADGVLLMLDSSREETKEDLKLLHDSSDKKVIILFNKIDLPKKINEKKILNALPNSRSLEISALKGTNIESLKQEILSTFIPEEQNSDETILHLRQKLILEEISIALKEGSQLIENGYPDEICAEEIRQAISLVGRLTGEIRTDEILNETFGSFCVGK